MRSPVTVKSISAFFVLYTKSSPQHNETQTRILFNEGIINNTPSIMRPFTFDSAHL